jgi:putative exporter of polyketide antibiotics
MFGDCMDVIKSVLVGTLAVGVFLALVICLIVLVVKYAVVVLVWGAVAIVFIICYLLGDMIRDDYGV